jgi:hypothetical protein
MLVLSLFTEVGGLAAHERADSNSLSVSFLFKVLEFYGFWVSIITSKLQLLLLLLMSFTGSGVSRRTSLVLVVAAAAVAIADPATDATAEAEGVALAFVILRGVTIACLADDLSIEEYLKEEDF